MADNYDYLDLVGPQGQDQLKTLLTDMRALVSEIVNANKAAKGFEFNAQGAKSLKDITISSQQLVDANGKLVAAQATLNGKYKEATTLISQFNGQSKEVVQVQQEVIKLKSLEEKAARASARANEQATGAYKALNAEYRKAANAAKELAALHGVESEQAKKAAAEALKLSDNLKKIDASVGQNQRNVGNYKSAFDGLGFSIRNIAGELPNLGISLRTFAQSISNNIGPLTDALKQAREQNKLLVAEGKPTVSIGKQIASSIFSWQTAILAAVAAITYLVSVMGKNNKAMGDADKATERYKKTLESLEETERNSAQQEIARVNVLASIAANRNTSDKVRLRAVKELQDTYPARFGALNKEILLEGKAADAIRATTQELLSRAAAQAAEKRFAAASEVVYDLTLAQRKATQEAATAQKAYELAFARSQSSAALAAKESTADIVESYRRRANDAKATLDKINKDIAAATAEQKAFLNDAVSNAAKAGDTIFNTPDAKPKKPKKAKAIKEAKDLATDVYAELIKQSETEAAVQKAISENIEVEFDKRLEAYDRYTQEQLVLAGLYAASEEAGVMAYQKRLTVVSINALKERGKMEAEEKERQRKISEENIKGVGTVGPTSSGKQREQDERERKASAERAAQESIQFAQTLANTNNAITQTRIDAINREIDLINKRRDAEIEAIEASGLSAQQKEEKIAAIKGEAAAKTKKLEEDALQRRRRAAIFEKGVTIAQIVATTALAVVKALAEGDYITKVVRVGLAAATGAAQLAAAIAAPIPQYAKGTQSSGEGLAIVGEKGPELQINPDGSASMTPGVPTLTYLQQGTKIIPAHEVLEMSKMYGMGLPIARQQSGLDTRRLEGKLDEVVKAVKGKKETEQIFTWMGILNQARIGQSTVRRIHNQKH